MEVENKQEKLVRIAINIPESKRDMIQKVVAKSSYNNVSEFVRAGIDKELDIQMYKDSLDFVVKELSKLIDMKLDGFINSQRKLYANNVDTGKSVEVTANNNWSYSFTNLLEYDDEDVLITYKVVEDLGELADNYLVREDGDNIINVYKYTTTSVNAVKTWGENTTNKPEVTFRIRSTTPGYTYSNTINLNDTDIYGWSYTWDVLKYLIVDGNDNEIEINYVVEEISIDGTEVSGNEFLQYNSVRELIGKWISTTTGNMNDGFVITNVWKDMPKKELKIKKVANIVIDNNKITGYDELQGAKFVLYRYIGGDVPHDDLINLTQVGSAWVQIGDEFSSDLHGDISFGYLYEGEYRLIEIEAPTNHILPSGQWKILVSSKPDDTEQLIIRFEGIECDDSLAVLEDSDNDQFLIPNKEVPIIPSTGGIGMPNYSKYGLSMILISIGICIINLLKQLKNI